MCNTASLRKYGKLRLKTTFKAATESGMKHQTLDKRECCTSFYYGFTDNMMQPNHSSLIHVLKHHSNFTKYVYIQTFCQHPNKSQFCLF